MRPAARVGRARARRTAKVEVERPHIALRPSLRSITTVLITDIIEAANQSLRRPTSSSSLHTNPPPSHRSLPSPTDKAW